MVVLLWVIVVLRSHVLICMYAPFVCISRCARLAGLQPLTKREFIPSYFPGYAHRSHQPYYHSCSPNNLSFHYATSNAHNSLSVSVVVTLITQIIPLSMTCPQLTPRLAGASRLFPRIYLRVCLLFLYTVSCFIMSFIIMDIYICIQTDVRRAKRQRYLIHTHIHSSSFSPCFAFSNYI